jgi:hypothetical protein
MRKPLLFLSYLASFGACLALIYLPFYMHSNWIGVVWFGGMGLVGLCGVLGSMTRSNAAKELLEYLEERIPMLIAGIFVSVLALYFLYLLLKEIFGP